MPVEHFASKSKYLRNLSYRHIHGIPFRAQEVVVGGKRHKVKHSKSKERRKLDRGK